MQDNYHRFCTFPPHRVYLTLVVGNFFGHFAIKPAGEGDAGKRISEYLDTIWYELEYRFPELFPLNADVSYDLGPVSVNFSGFNLIVHHRDTHSLSNILYFSFCVYDTWSIYINGENGDKQLKTICDIFDELNLTYRIEKVQQPAPSNTLTSNLIGIFEGLDLPLDKRKK